LNTTRLDYRLLVTGSGGDSLLDKQKRAVKRGDSESLDLSESVARSVEREIARLQRRLQMQ
jgi:hypothetical protein